MEDRERATPDGDERAAQEKETGRIEAFSDGVFAIAVTLLVLDLKVPHRDSVNSGLMNILVKQWPSFLAYLISFATILIMWVNHHNLFNKVKRTDTPFMFLNGFLLFLITFVPFPTGLLAEYIH